MKSKTVITVFRLHWGSLERARLYLKDAYITMFCDWNSLLFS